MEQQSNQRRRNSQYEKLEQTLTTNYRDFASETKSKWKFRFKNAEMVEDSDIGPINTKLTPYDIKSVLRKTVFRFLRNSFNIYILIYLILYTFSKHSPIFGSISPGTAFIFLGFNLFLSLGTNLYILNKTKKLDGFWDKKSIMKLTKKKGRKIFVNVNIEKLKIGDLVLVKANSTCPADVLIIDTSEQRHSEKIAHANERRLNGRYGIQVKTAVKNMNPIEGNNKKIKPDSSLKKLMQILKGQIEYDSPNSDMKNFSGTFKLSNDPKVLRIDKNNFLFCGSRLYSNWVIGFVLYNGQSTKIIQRNAKKLGKGYFGKISTLDRFVNYFGILCMGYCVLEILFLYLALSTIRTNRYELIKHINEFLGADAAFGFFLMRIYQIFLGLALKAPLVIQPILKIMNIFYVIKLETDSSKEAKESSEEFNMLDIVTLKDLKSSNPKSSKKKIVSKDDEPIIEKTKKDEIIMSSRSQKDKNVLSSSRGFLASRTVGSKSINLLQRSRSLPFAQEVKKPLFKKNEKSVRVINPNILSDLGNIDHVFFDKTDTLTLSTVDIIRVSTLSKLFKINMRMISRSYNLVKKNPSKYQRVEDLEEVMRQKEDENYSEKSQEFYKEVKGEYDPEIFDEEMFQNDEVFRNIRKPEYLTMSGSGKKKSKSGDQSEISIFQSMTSRNNSLTNTATHTAKNLVRSTPKRRSAITTMMHKTKTSVDFSMASLMANLSKKEKIFKKKLEQLTYQNSKKSIKTRTKFPNLDTIDEKSRIDESRTPRSGYDSYSSGSFSYVEEPEGMEIKLKVNPNKPLEQEDLLCDYYFKSEELLELLDCLILCHEATTSSSGKIKSFRGEEKAILELCSKLGLGFEIQDLKNDPDFYKVFKVKMNKKLNGRYNIAGMNSWSIGRQRMSIVINDPKRGRDAFVIYVRGNQIGMKGVMKMNQKEKNNFKRLMVSFRKECLKPVIFAKKSLSYTTAKSYIKTFNLIRKSRNDQIENFEKLAIEIEKDLEFVGALGYKSNDRAGAKDLIQTFESSEIGISLLTGDKIENTINVSTSLKLVDIDFRDSSEFYSLRFNSLTEAASAIKRILEYIYEEMRELSVLNLENENKIIKRSTLGEKELQKQKKLYRLKTDVFLSEKKINECKEDSSKGLKKTILISGRALDIILSDEKLISHFKFLLIFAKNIVGFSLSAYHKSVIVKFFKEIKKISVMAVGDGFNDMAMLEASDVGVQIYHKDVPLIFGDIITPDLKMISNIMFFNGKMILANSLQAIILSFFNYLMMSALELYFMIDSLFTGSLFSGTHMIIFSIVQIISLSLMGIRTNPYKKEVLFRFPIIYKEKNFLLKNFFKTTSAFFIFCFAETCYIYVSLRFWVVRRFKTEGYVAAREEIELIFFTSLIILSVSRVYFSMYTKAGPVLAIGLGVVLLIYLILIIIGASLKSIYNPFSVLRIFRSLNIFIPLVHTIAAPLLIEWICIIGFKNIAIYPIFKEIMDRYKNKDFMFFLKDSKKKISKLLFKGVKCNLINSAKNCYQQDTADLDRDIKRILSLDSNHLSLGMNPFTCRISDLNDSKRFELYINKKQLSLVQFSVSMAMIFSFVELIILNIFNPIDNINYYFDTSVPYIFVILLIPLFFASEKKYQKSTKNFLILAFILVVVLTCIISFNTAIPVDYGLFIFIRFAAGPIITDFIACGITIIAVLILTLISQGSSNISQRQQLFGVFAYSFMTDLFSLRMFLNYVISMLFYIGLKLKFDSMVKMDYLLKTNIKNEYVVASEKLEILMPKFVLNRIDSYRMNQGFVADDAGVVTILFCDICDFDEVIEECQDSIVEVLDEIFRAFDFLCNKYGIQKIETVGKTYMACGGLKFVEKDLPPALKAISPTERVVKLCKEFFKFIDGFTYKNGKKLVLKIGVHKGQCVFGILGYHKPQFSLIGDTVNTTSRHCTTGERGGIILSKAAYKDVQYNKKYKFRTADAYMKGKGNVKTYILQGKKKKRAVSKMMKRRRSSNFLTPNKTLKSSDRSVSRIKLLDPSPRGIKKILEKKKTLEVPDNISQMIDISIDHQDMGGESPNDTIRGGDDFEEFDSIESQRFDTEGLRKEEDEKKVSKQGSLKFTAMHYDERDLDEDSDGSIDFEDILKKEKIDNRKVDLNKGSAFELLKHIKSLEFEKNELERYFLRKTLIKHEFKINAALILICIDIITRELCLFGDTQIEKKFYIIRILNFLLTIFLIFLASIYYLKTKPRMYKKHLIGFLVTRVSSRIIEIGYYIALKDNIRTQQLVFEMVKTLQIEVVFMIISGIFYIKEILLFQGLITLIAIPLVIGYLGKYAGYQIFILITTFIFNGIDSYFHSSYEIYNFNNFIKIERKSLHLSQFVNRLLPKHIQDRITEPGAKLGQIYNNVTLLYADIVGFTAYSNENGARKVVEMLSRLFTAFDKECSRLGLYKVYTIGDCYVVMSLLDENNRKSPQEEANDVTLLAISMIDNINKIRDKFQIDLNMRIGIHTGDIIGGVIGTDLVRFDIYGQDVVVANKMESKGHKGKINVSETTRKLLEDNETCNYSFAENKEIFVKSTGKNHMSYFLGFD